MNWRFRHCTEMRHINCALNSYKLLFSSCVFGCRHYLYLSEMVSLDNWAGNWCYLVLTVYLHCLKGIKLLRLQYHDKTNHIFFINKNKRLYIFNSSDRICCTTFSLSIWNALFDDWKEPKCKTNLFNFQKLFKCVYFH